jgi:hypothetical protein
MKLFHDYNIYGHNKYPAINSPWKWITSSQQDRNPKVIGQFFLLRELLGFPVITKYEDNITSYRKSLSPELKSLMAAISATMANHRSTSALRQQLQTNGDAKALPKPHSSSGSTK